MSIENVDTRFALIANNGDVLYPYKKIQRATGRFGFALSAPGERDAFGGGVYLPSLEEVISRVVFQGWKMRATTINKPTKQRHGSLSLSGSAIVGYWIADDLRHLVKAAGVQPLAFPGRQP